MKIGANENWGTSNQLTFKYWRQKSPFGSLFAKLFLLSQDSSLCQERVRGARRRNVK